MKIEDILKKQGELYKNLTSNKLIEECNKRPKDYKKEFKAFKKYLKPEMTNLIKQGKMWSKSLEDSMNILEQISDPSFAHEIIERMIAGLGDINYNNYDEEVKKLKKIMKKGPNVLGYNLLKYLVPIFLRKTLKLGGKYGDKEVLEAAWKKLGADRNEIFGAPSTPTERHFFEKLLTRNDKIDHLLQLSYCGLLLCLFAP